MRDLLARNPCTRELQIEHVHSCDEGINSLAAANYDLILFTSDIGTNTAHRMLAELRSRNLSVPVVCLTEDADQSKVAAIIEGGACGCILKAEVNENSLVRPLRCAFSLRRSEHQRREAEDMLRKLLRAVEQSADLVIITDKQGAIEYVNPAFEALTGYTRQEVMGKNPRILKSGQQPRALYRELWTTILAGRVFRGTLANRKKMASCFTPRRPSLPYGIAKAR